MYEARNTSGADIVSFNFDASQSFGKKQGFNAPIGNQACFAYTTALNYLLKSCQTMNLGEATTVIFWGERKIFLKFLLSELFDNPPKDDPDRMTSIRSLYDAPQNGVYLLFEDRYSNFLCLGISPTPHVLSIRFFWKSTVKEFPRNIKQHFDDLQICSNARKSTIFSPYINSCKQSLYRGEIKNLPPNLSGNILKSIFQGSCYPQPPCYSFGKINETKNGISQSESGYYQSLAQSLYEEKFNNEKEI